MKAGFALIAALLLAPLATAQEGPFASSYYDGHFDDELFENDWFYDRYDEPITDWSDAGNWYYNDELYAGIYDDGIVENDWFFDAYDDPGEEGLFDV